MTHFLLNNQTIATDEPPGTALLDFLRYHQHLTGTKIGCREGDCGACTILVGELRAGGVTYASATSCLMPLGNAAGKHIVTIEGINGGGLTPVQEAMAEEGATQCGFCTPGFVVSMTGYCLGSAPAESLITAIDGNICRCTGYKSIERAAQRIAALLPDNGSRLETAIGLGIVPEWFAATRDRLVALQTHTDGQSAEPAQYRIGGGTDLFVQKHGALREASLQFMNRQEGGRMVKKENGWGLIGATATVSDILHTPWMVEAFPDLKRYIKLVSSTPIRNMATIAGNLVNASPIGDFTIFFLALDARLELAGPTGRRMLPLRDFYLGYKQLAKAEDEHIETIRFRMPGADTKLHFEKVSKRMHLDIASVNSAICLQMEGNRIRSAGVSAGGVAPVPKFLQRTSTLLEGGEISEALVLQAVATAREEVQPISDARGTAEYKRLLLGQLIKAHFLQLFPQLQPHLLIQPA